MAFNAEIPEWLLRLPSNDGQFQHITRKTLTASDVAAQQHRLLIPSRPVKDNLWPLLSDGERARPTQVKVYTRNTWWFNATLTRWTTGSTVINGTDYATLVTVGEFRQGDVIEMWAFRSGEELCFAIYKIE